MTMVQFATDRAKDEGVGVEAEDGDVALGVKETDMIQMCVSTVENVDIGFQNAQNRGAEIKGQAHQGRLHQIDCREVGGPQKVKSSLP